MISYWPKRSGPVAGTAAAGSARRRVPDSSARCGAVGAAGALSGGGGVAPAGGRRPGGREPRERVGEDAVDVRAGRELGLGRGGRRRRQRDRDLRRGRGLRGHARAGSEVEAGERVAQALVHLALARGRLRGRGRCRRGDRSGRRGGSGRGWRRGPWSRRRRRSGVLLQIREDVRENVVRRQRRRGRRELRRVDPHGLGADVRRLQRVLDGTDQILVVERPRQDVEGADLLRVGLSVRAPVAAHHQEDGRSGRAALLPDLPDDFGARQPRQHAREQDHVELAGPEGLEPGFPVVSLGQRVPEGGQQRTNPLDVARLVLDQKNFLGHGLKAIVAENPIKSRRSTDSRPSRLLI